MARHLKTAAAAAGNSEADAGVRAIVQPGGSIRDAEVVEAATKAGITMYFTGARHFAH